MVFTRSGVFWTQQGNKLVGSGAYWGGEPPFAAGQGMSVALSADGNTASWWVGAGAAWVFICSAGVWTQQGKLVAPVRRKGPPRCVGRPVRRRQHRHRGGWSDNSKTGAAWVFTRSGGVWTQQGKKLSAPTLWEAPAKACPSRCPPTAIPPSWWPAKPVGSIGALRPWRGRGRRGCSPAVAASDAASIS